MANKIKLKGKNFDEEYERLCIIQNQAPLPHLTANLKENFLDFNADRIRLSEWDPIIGALKVNNSLRFVAIRSYWQSAHEGDDKFFLIVPYKLSMCFRSGHGFYVFRSSQDLL